VISLLVTATDGVTSTTRRFGLVVRQTPVVPLTFSLASTFLNDATVGQSFATTLTASGGTAPYSWAVAGGSSLPPGLSLVSGSALRVTDTPGATLLAGAPSTAGQYTFDLIVTDANAATLRRTFTLNVSVMGILSGNIRTPTVGSAYTETFTPVGGTGPYTFTMTPASLVVDMLPPGLTFSPSGIISGTPTSGGSFGFILKARLEERFLAGELPDYGDYRKQVRMIVPFVI